MGAGQLSLQNPVEATPTKADPHNFCRAQSAAHNVSSSGKSNNMGQAYSVLALRLPFFGRLRKIMQVLLLPTDHPWDVV